MMANAERQVSGIGPGSKDEPFVQVSVGGNQPNQNLGKLCTTNLPFEISKYKDQMFDIFEKLITLRRQLENAKENPSIKKSHKYSLDGAIKVIDDVNLDLLKIPEILQGFDVDIQIFSVKI